MICIIYKYEKICKYLFNNCHFLLPLDIFFIFLYLSLGPNNLNLLSPEHGVYVGGDAERYITAAEQIILGNFPNYPDSVGEIDNAQGYMGYNLFLVIMFLLNLNYFSISIVQIFISGVAGLCIFQIGKIIWNKEVGLLSMLIFLFYPSIQIFNFLFTY